VHVVAGDNAMTIFKLILLFVMMFSLPSILYFANEHLLGQILFFSQLVVVWGLLPFMFRGERATPRDWNKKTWALTFVVIAASIGPFLIHLTERSYLVSTDITKSSVSMFSDSSEIFLVLGTALATLFVIAALIKRRGQEV
jgi:hypothetical protein